MSRDDTTGPVRRSRVVARPKVLPGPLQELKDLLYELYLTAGPPTLDEIAAWITADDSLAGTPARDTIHRCISSEDLPVNQHDAVAVATVLARAAKWDADDAGTRIRDLWVQAAMATPVGRPLSEVTDPFALEVHRAIDAGPGHLGLPELPPYLERDHDRELRKRVHEAIRGHSMMVVLVGRSSTGKTRACWEAIRQLPEGWRLWHPFNPTRTESALDTLNRVGPRTVVWLNETQHYLLSEGNDHGERVAATLRTLLTDKSRGPLLILGTTWPEYWDTLTRHPAPGQSESHAQARELLAGTHMTVADSFPEAVVKSLKISSGTDPRLVEAAVQAKDGELTQYLAGAPVLLERYETAPSAAKALIEAAMDSRRLGYGVSLPHSLFEAAVPDYLTDKQWDALDEDWLDRALAYATAPCRGSTAPLTRIRARPGQPTLDQPHYRLADYLEQTGRHRRYREIVPSQLWRALGSHTRNSTEADRIGVMAADRLLYCHAMPLLRTAVADRKRRTGIQLAKLLAGRGDVEGLRERADAGDLIAAVGWVEALAGQGDVQEAITVLRERADAGDLTAALGLAELLGERGDVEGLRLRADAGDEFAAHRLAEVLVGRGDVQEAITVLRKRADAGDEFAARRLAELLGERGDVEGLRLRADAGDQFAAHRLVKLLAARGDVEGLQQRADAGDQFAAHRLAEVLAGRGDVQGLRERADAGDESAALGLVEVLIGRGDVQEAITVLRERADAGDQFAAYRLAELSAGRGDVQGLRERADAGDPGAADWLAEVLVGRSDVDELRQRADAGDQFAAHRLAEVLVGRGDVQGLRERADAGDESAALGLVEVLIGRGDVQEAITVLRGRADAGDPSAADWLAEVLAGRGDVDALRQRADAGDQAATSRLAEVLAERGDVEGLRTELLRGNMPAVDHLITVVTKQSVDTGERLRQCGLNADGTIPWDNCKPLPQRPPAHGPPDGRLTEVI